MAEHLPEMDPAAPDAAHEGSPAAPRADSGRPRPKSALPPLAPDAATRSQSSTDPIAGPASSTIEAVPTRIRGAGLTPDGRLKAGRLAGLSMPRAIWVLAWPIFVEAFLNSLVGLTDTVLAAGLPAGDAATDAIGGASYILWLIGLVTMALGVGATALVSRAVGAARLAVARAVVGQTLLLALATGSIVGLIVWWASGKIAWILGMSDAATADFETYMRLIAMGVPLSSVLFSGIACLRATGNSLKPLGLMIVMNAVNIVVSFVLSGVDLRITRMEEGQVVSRVLATNPFGLDLGVAGIALGTVISYAVGAAIILALLVRGERGVRLTARRLRPHPVTMKRLVRLGVPNLFETFGLWFGNFLVLLLVGRMGEGLMGAHIVAIRIEALSFLPGFAMGMAAATLAGQYLGAGSPALARRAILSCLAVAVSFMGVAGLTLILARHTVVGWFTPQQAHLEVVPGLLIVCGAVQIPFAVGIVLREAMRGAGDVRVCMIITWIATYAVRLPLAYLLSGVDVPLPGGGVIEHPLRDAPSLQWLWVGLCVELVVRALLFGGRFLHGGWARRRV